jgi:hypothetical protein
MTDLIRRFRGMGVALVVLAMSAGVVLAGAPHFTPVSNNTPAAEEPSGEVDESEAPESAEPSDEASEEASDDASAGAADALEAPSGDTHGALVSTAAQMDTPDGFPNHGAFVSCVAHMDKGIVVDGFDWTTVTPESCGIAPAADSTATTDSGPGKSQAGKTHGQGKAHSSAAKTKTKGKPGS